MWAMAPDHSARTQVGRTLQPPWGLLVLGLATSVVAGILAMHGFSVGHHMPGEASTQQVDSSTSHQTHQDPASSGAHSCPSPGCDEHGSMAAMCLFMLLWLVTLVPRRGGSSWRWQPPWVTWLAAQSPPPPGHLSRVSLIRLCISRT